MSLSQDAGSYAYQIRPATHIPGLTDREISLANEAEKQDKFLSSGAELLFQAVLDLLTAGR